MKMRLLERIRSLWVILYESAASFIRNDDFRSAASLAFYTALALIPVFFLLTFALAAALGSSQAAFSRTESLAQQFLPRYSGVILREVDAIAHLKRALGVINIVLLVWAGTPLVSSLRSTLNGIFRVQEEKHFAIEKLMDILKVIMVILFLVVISTVTVLDLLLDIIRDFVVLTMIPSYLDTLAHAVTSIFVLCFLYFLFIPRTPLRYILIGALTSTGLWLAMEPAFNAFLSYNPRYGFVFGSLKSLFILMIWIYYSISAFLFGSEVIAAMKRKGSIYVRRLLEGKGGVPSSVKQAHVISFRDGETIFLKGEKDSDMFYVLSGAVSLRKEETEILIVGPGHYFGVMGLLLDEPRLTSAVALEDTELVVINTENMRTLTHESPELVWKMLKDLAKRFREVDKLIQ